MKSKLLYALFFLNFVFFITSSAKAQWQPCQGLEGGSVGNVIKSDSFLLVSSSYNIYRTDTNFFSPWEKCNDYGGGTLVKVDSCIFSYGNMLGIIRSFDNGMTWNPIEESFSPLTMCSVDNNIFLDYYSFILRSDDYLDTFEIITSLPELEFPQVWSHDSLLIVKEVYYDTIYQSIDSGNSWDTITSNGLPNGSLLSDISCFNNNIWFGGTFGVYFLSPDRTIWMDANSILLEGSSIYDLNDWNDELYCSTLKKGLYKLNLSDTSWIHIENSPKEIRKLTKFNNELFCATSYGPYSMDTSGNWYAHLQGLFHRTIFSLMELNETIYLFANEELFKSVDDGDNFEKISNVNGDQIIATDSVLYVLSRTDVIISRDNALSWDTITAGLERNIYHLSITNDYYYVSGSKGLFRSNIDSIDWIELENGLSGGSVYYFEAIDSVVIVEDQNGDCISISKDYGNTFDLLLNTGNNSTPIRKKNNQFYILNQSIILYSDDLGETWEEIIIDDPYCRAKSIDQNEDYLVVGGYTSAIYPYLSISTNNGKTWTDLVGNLPWLSYSIIDNVNIHNERLFASSSQNSLWYRDDILTGISENNLSKEKFDKIYLYPNPVSDVITLEFSSTQENCQFRIFDIRGSEQIHGKIIEMKTYIDLGKLKAGIYIIEVLTTSEKINQKIIKY